MPTTHESPFDEREWAKRSERLVAALSFLDRTRQFQISHGRAARGSHSARLDQLRSALEAGQELRLVVLGEFSRGKSSLLNALLGMKLLPAALPPTNCINFFIRAPVGREVDRTLTVVFRDPKLEPKRHSWNSTEDLKRWTELGKDPNDEHDRIDRINLWLDHPLLRSGLCIIDTPGMGSIHAAHYEVTKEAMDQSHVALWLQSAAQLGGSQMEWTFLSETLRRNFRKFLTVITHWSAVLEPNDFEEKRKPEGLRVEESLDVVRTNFSKQPLGLSQDELGVLTSDSRMFPVDSIWGQEPSGSQNRARSGIDNLAARLQQMMLSGEAAGEVLAKPLKTLLAMQDETRADLAEELRLLGESSDLVSLTTRRDQAQTTLDRLEHRRAVELERTKASHAAHARELAAEVAAALMPLRDMKGEVDALVTLEWVQRRVQDWSDQFARNGTAVLKLELPEDAKVRYDRCVTEFSASWDGLMKTATRRLVDLRAEFAEGMKDVTKEVDGLLGGIGSTLPPLEVGHDVDVEGYANHFRRKLAAEQEVQEQRNKLEEIEDGAAEAKLRQKKALDERQRLVDLERKLEVMGSPPPPRVREVRETKKEPWYRPDKQYTRDVVDDSNTRSWHERQQKLAEKIANKEREVDACIEAAEASEGVRLTREAARRRVEQALAKQEAALDALKRDLKERYTELATQAANSLRAKTVNQLERLIRTTERDLSPAIERLFDHQLRLLETQIKEQYEEPMRVKRDTLREVLDLLEQGEAAMTKRSQQLTEALSQLVVLSVDTNHLYSRVEADLREGARQ